MLSKLESQAVKSLTLVTCKCRRRCTTVKRSRFTPLQYGKNKFKNAVENLSTYMKITTGLAQLEKQAEFKSNHRMNTRATQIYPET